VFCKHCGNWEWVHRNYIGSGFPACRSYHCASTGISEQRYLHSLSDWGVPYLYDFRYH